MLLLGGRILLRLVWVLIAYCFSFSVCSLAAVLDVAEQYISSRENICVHGLVEAF